MKTKIFNLNICVLIILFTQSIKAQSITGGLMGGVSTGAVKVSEIGSGFTDVIEGKNIYGFEAGIFGKLQGGPFYVRPQLLYNWRGGKVKFKEIQEENESNVDFRISKLELPVLLGMNILGPLSIEAGPVYNYVLSVTKTYGGKNIELGKNGFGYRIGATLDVKSIFFNVSYEGIAFNITSNTAKFREPYKLLFGIGIQISSPNANTGGGNIIINN